jgi:hypothetical protein
MKREGKLMMKERHGEFSFGEWAEESDREIIENVTGFSLEEFSDDEVDNLLNIYLGC